MDWVQIYAVVILTINFIASLVLDVKKGRVGGLIATFVATAIMAPLYGRIWGWW